MQSLLRPIAARAKEHLASMWRSPDYRRLQRLQSRLRRVPRYRHVELEVDGWHLHAPDAASLFSSYREIVNQGIYRFAWDSPRPPRMLDLGANIGLAVLDLKRRHPHAHVLALEPDPKVCAYLRRNLGANGAADVDVRQVAAWTEPATLRFLSEGADAGRLDGVTANADREPASIDVEAVDVRTLFADGPFDLVKIDIEGAEKAVLPVCAHVLGETRFLFVEYHGAAGERGHLAETIAFMHGLGYRVQVQPIFHSMRPFESRPSHCGFELQLNLFGIRDR